MLARRGATVLGTARSDAKAQRASESLDGDAVPLVCYLTDPSPLRCGVAGVRDRGRPLDAIVANAVHPGVSRTNLARKLPPLLQRTLSTVCPLFLKSVPQGAATQVYAVVYPEAAKLNGEYASTAASPHRARRFTIPIWHLFSGTSRGIVSALP